MNSQELRALQEAYSQVCELDEELTGERAERAKEIMKGSRPYGRKRVSTDAKYNAAKRALTAGEGSTKSPSRDIRGDEKLPTGRGGRGIKGRAKTVTQSNGSQTDRGRGNKATRRSGGDVEDTRYDESYDLYDIILSHLLDEGYAETEDAAESIMANMSEEWRESILG